MKHMIDNSNKNGAGMKNVVIMLFAVSILATAVSPALAGAFRNPNQFKGAPGPIVGAGLPVLGLGYGAYWLLRRYRRKPE